MGFRFAERQGDQIADGGFPDASRDSNHGSFESIPNVRCQILKGLCGIVDLYVPCGPVLGAGATRNHTRAPTRERVADELFAVKLFPRKG